MNWPLFAHLPRAFALFACLMLLSSTALAALEWPQEITVSEGTIVVYQPQPEKLSGNVLSGRAAISLESGGQEGPVFGAMWFTARIDTDRDTDTALVRDLRVESVRWPDSNDASEQRFTAIVEGAMPQAGFEISMERLAASLASAEIEQQSLAQLKSDPPKIVFSDELAVLLLYDGEPRFSPIENSPYERALNTPFAVVRHAQNKTCYLTSGAYWYQSNDPLGPWSAADQPPADLVQNMPPPDSDQPQPTTPPVIVVAAEPTELIATDGRPNWTSLAGGELLYVENTETPWLRELATNNMYLLLSGRWFRSKSEAGPWTFVRADELPPSFQDIPPASDIGGLRTSVAGTEEADDAIRDAAIPQTAAIKRSEASLTVEYDGAPKFESIEGTAVSYAVNTGAQVLLIGGRYYAADNGVWFTSAAATGPWVVADDVPEDEIAQIPPSSPVYNTTHVHVYQSTPDIVYVGYTPGYLWSFPYYGVPVYGTGWYYPPYYGRWYYPRPATWGFNVGYNPWTGWSFGLSWSNGFFRFGVGWGGGYGGYYRPWGCCGGWYGGGYRGPVFINTGDINIGNNVNIGNRVQVGDRMEKNPQIANRLQESNRNLYQKPENRSRNADRAAAARDLKQARPAPGRDNNVFADRSGQVARRDGDQWQTREGGQWKPAPGNDRAELDQRPTARPSSPSARPATPSGRPVTPSSRPSTMPTSRPSIDRRDLNRSHQARQSGRSREMSRPAPHGGQRQRRH
jgi:hypothetical protein